MQTNDTKLAPETVLEHMLGHMLGPVKKLDPFIRCLRTHQKLIAIPVSRAVVALFFLKNGTNQNEIGVLEGINKHYMHDAIAYSREFDVLSSHLLCECKCVNWTYLNTQEVDEKIAQFEDQAEIVFSDPKPRKFLVISYFPLTEAVIQTLNKLKVSFVDPNNQGDFVDLFTHQLYKLTC